MIVQIDFNEGGDNSNVWIFIDKDNFKKLKELNKKYHKEGCPTFFLEYLKDEGLEFKKIIPDEFIEV